MIAVLLFSCNDYAPIFASIETEELIETSNLHDNATTLGMANLNNTYYVATGGAMWQRHVDAKNWDRTSLPSTYEGVISLVQATKNIAYAIFAKNYYVDISEYALYRMEVQTNEVKFTSIHTMSAADYSIRKLFVDDTGNVYVALEENDGYRYYKDYQLSSPVELKDGCKGVTHCDDAITGVAEMKGTVYISTETQIFILQNDTLTEVVPVSIKNKKGTTSLTGWIGGIYYSKEYKKLYLSNEGYIWTLDNSSTTWNRSSEQSGTFFTNFIDINQTGFEGVLVGTKRFLNKGKYEGYREMNKGDIGSIATPIGNKYTSGNLNTAGVSGFFLDDQTTLFVFTKGQGLWRGTYTVGRNVDWFLE